MSRQRIQSTEAKPAVCDGSRVVGGGGEQAQEMNIWGQASLNTSKAFPLSMISEITWFLLTFL